MPRHPLTSALAQNLRRFRDDAGLTQLQLAEAADVADATISRIERGRLAPSAALLAKLAGALRVNLGDLLGAPREPKQLTLRAPIARLVALVRDLDDAEVDDVTKAVKLLLAVGRRSGATPPRGVEDREKRDRRTPGHILLSTSEVAIPPAPRQLKSRT